MLPEVDLTEFSGKSKKCALPDARGSVRGGGPIPWTDEEVISILEGRSRPDLKSGIQDTHNYDSDS